MWDFLRILALISKGGPTLSYLAAENSPDREQTGNFIKGKPILASGGKVLLSNTSTEAKKAKIWGTGNFFPRQVVGLRLLLGGIGRHPFPVLLNTP